MSRPKSDLGEEYLAELHPGWTIWTINVTQALPIVRKLRREGAEVRSMTLDSLAVIAARSNDVHHPDRGQ